MSNAFEGLEPKLLFNYFEKLTRIPRCSKNEAGAIEFVLSLAREKGLEAERDGAGNVVVRLPATAGYENAPTVVLQGHLDMVGEKSADSPHDFARDPIKVIRDGDWLTADGTTLGADNGIGLAAALALMDDKEAVHGPLELLFTVDEETGLTGAQALEPGFVKGKMLLNLDSEEEGAIYVGCAGGADTEIVLPLEREQASGDRYEIVVSGLKGGHSGLDINTGRANAIKVCAWYLFRLLEQETFGLVSISGGDKHNAIPRDARAEIVLAAGAAEKARELVEKMQKELSERHRKTDPGLKIELRKGGGSDVPLSGPSRDRLVNLLVACPHGVLAMSQDVEGLVETSTNLAVVRCEKDRAVVLESSRSSVQSAIDEVQEGLIALARIAGAEATSQGGYPGWTPNMDSPLLAEAREVYKKVTGKDAEIKAIHAGLECGIIGEKFGDMDMISFGPDIQSPHSPSERVNIASTARFYEFLKALLAELARG
ncbi:MAG: aminoacyl-histidine dipeptidase [Deltaproteobacteria bacterium]|nr:MAG: aminoacyl-histidine dipeptidase [Deltaproteobacteria bacterium]